MILVSVSVWICSNVSIDYVSMCICLCACMSCACVSMCMCIYVHMCAVLQDVRGIRSPGAGVTMVVSLAVSGCESILRIELGAGS